MDNKKNLNRLRTNYCKIPVQLFDLNLSPQAIAIYCYMVSLPGSFNPATTLMCNVLRMSRNTLYRYIKELTNCGAIVQVRAGSLGQSAVYAFTDPKKWARLEPVSREMQDTWNW